MKKIVGILGMAAVLATAAFAAEPAANFVLSEFTGSAGFGWKADFTDTDNVKMGMFNDATASIKFGLITEGTKATTGDGIWGDLQIKCPSLDWSAGNAVAPIPSVEVAKIHFVDGDFSAALNIKAQNGNVGGVKVPTATPVLVKKVGAIVDPNAADRTAKSNAVNEAQTKYDAAYREWIQALNGADDSAVTTKKTALDEAKTTLDKAKAELAKVPAAPTSGPEFALGTAGLNPGNFTNGFALELGMKDLFDLSVSLVDKNLTAAKDKEVGLGINAALKAVPNLNANVAAAFNFQTGYIGLQAKADYKLGIGDKLYVKPVVAYEMVKNDKDTDATNALTAGALFGWGATDAENTLDFFGKYKFNEGVSVALCPIFGDKTDFLLSVGAYDQSLFNLLGISDFGTLKTAVAYDALFCDNDALNKSYVTFATAYEGTFSPVYLNAHFGMQAKMEGKDAEFKPALAFGVKAGTKEIIDNTDVYVGYDLAVDTAKKDDKITGNALTIGTKISF